jgi:hypothetical protein
MTFARLIQMNPAISAWRTQEHPISFNQKANLSQLTAIQQQSPAFHFSAPNFSAIIFSSPRFLTEKWWAEKWDQSLNINQSVGLLMSLERQSRFFVCTVSHFRTRGFKLAANPCCSTFQKWDGLFNCDSKDLF